MGLSNSNFKKIFIFQETETPKNFFIFSQKKAFLIFRGTEAPKKFFIFEETEIPKRNFVLFQETETLKKTSYISGSDFPNSKYKKNPLLKSFLYFGKWNFLAPSLKNLLYFRSNLECLKIKQKNLL